MRKQCQKSNHHKERLIVSKNPPVKSDGIRLFYMKEFQKSDENLGHIIVINAIDNIFQQKSTDQNCQRGNQHCL